jgi:hypothetical protein
MSQEVGQACTKSVEVSMGMYGTSVRSQIDAVQITLKAQMEHLEQAQQHARMESETNVVTKLNGLLTQMQQTTKSEDGKVISNLETSIRDSVERMLKQEIETVKDLRKFMEHATQNQQDRFQDMYSMMSSVLEQACGAKSKAGDCADSLKNLEDGLLCGDDRPPSYNGSPMQMQSGTFNSTRNGGRPISANGSHAASNRDQFQRDQRGSGSSKTPPRTMPTKYSQYGAQMVMDHNHF